MGRMKSFLRLDALVLLLVILFFGVFPGHGRLQLPVGKNTPAISIGERHGVILASDGSLWVWGADLLGWPTLGLGTNTMKSTVLRRIGNETNWVSISAGISQTLALKSDGTIWTWGESLHSQFGSAAPIYTPILAAPGNDWKQVAAGGIFAAALKKDGTLWEWGNNWPGCLGVPSAKFGSIVPLQVGTSTNWVRVWAGILETVALQSDGSLWYWGENPNPSFAQGTNTIRAPKRVSPDTNWVDVGFGANTVFAIKSDGTLWAWGRHADAYTGETNLSKCEIPLRVGTNSDWQSFASTSDCWWINGLTKKDGSLWMMDGSGSNNNSPPAHSPILFKRLEFPKKHVAFAAGSVHAASAGVHGPITVILTEDGEVWTCGMEMGDPPTLKSRIESFVTYFIHVFQPYKKVSAPEPGPIYHDKPWRLKNQD